MKWRFVRVEKIWAFNTGLRLRKTRKIPVYLKVIGTFALEIFWIERIMRRVPCIFCELRGHRIYTASFYFAERGALLYVCGMSWVSSLSVLREYVYVLPRVVDMYTNTGEWEGEGVCISRHFLLMHSPRYACIFISRHKRIYWLRSLIRISTLCHVCDKPAKKKYNLSLV